MSLHPHQLTIQKIVEMQDAPDNTHLYLLQQGLFYHAYNQSAVFFRGITGYKVRRMPWRGTYVEQLGIPCTVIEGTLHSLQRKHPESMIECMFYAPHLAIELPREVVKNIPYETIQPRAPRTPIPTHVQQAVCDAILSLDADTAPAEKLRHTMLRLQQMIRHKAQGKE